MRCEKCRLTECPYYDQEMKDLINAVMVSKELGVDISEMDIDPSDNVIFNYISIILYEMKEYEKEMYENEMRRMEYNARGK